MSHRSQRILSMALEPGACRAEQLIPSSSSKSVKQQNDDIVSILKLSSIYDVNKRKKKCFYTSCVMTYGFISNLI